MKKGITREVIVIMVLALIIAFILFALYQGWVKSIGGIADKIFGLG